VSEQNEIKALGDTLRRDWEEMKSQMSRQDASVADVKQTVERVNAAIGATEEKIKKVEADLTLKIARVEQLETAAKEGTEDVEAKEMAHFDSWVRKGLDADGRETKKYKSLATDSDVDGGYTVPAPMRGRMIELLREVSPVRSLVTVETIGAGNAFEYPKEGANVFAAGKVGQRDARSQTANGDFAMERIPVHEFYANPWMTQTMVDDTGFDVEGWIARRVANRRAYLEGGYHISGTGEGEPEGLLTNSEIEYVASGDANEITDIGLISLVFDLPAPYARNAEFMWHRTITAKIRKFKDVTSGQFLWSPGLNGSTQGLVLGYKYTEAVDMPTETDNAMCVLFGDFKATYTIVDRKGITLTRDPYTNKPYIEMYFTWRTGGQVVLAEAMRKLKCAVS
jgi:HK97 family phage major capsid protein